MADMIASPEPALLEEHRRLNHQIGGLCRWASELTDIGQPRFGELGERLRELRSVLAAHFADEEAGGYLADALDAAPQFAHQAAELKCQHSQFLERLDGFIARLTAAQPPFRYWHDAQREFEDYLAQLQRHERAENDLVQAAFTDEPGSAA